MGPFPVAPDDFDIDDFYADVEGDVLDIIREDPQILLRLAEKIHKAGIEAARSGDVLARLEAGVGLLGVEAVSNTIKQQVEQRSQNN